MAISKRRIVINTFAGFGTRIASLGVVFLTTPVLVNRLGAEAFGLFAIAATLPAYAVVFDFGIGAGLVKYLTEYSEAGDRAGVRQVMTFSMIFYLMLGLVLLPVAFLFASEFADLLRLPEHLHRAGQIAVIVMCAYFVAGAFASVPAARLVSLHRMDITALVNLCSQVFYGVLVFIVIPRSPTVITALSLVASQSFVSVALLYAIVLRYDKNICCNPRAIPKSLIRSLFSFGGWIQLTSLMSVLSNEASKILIGARLTVATVTPYQIADRLASLNSIIPSQILSAIMPAATIVLGRRNHAEAEQFHSEVSRYVMLVTLALTGFIAAAANRLIVAWIGHPYPAAAVILVALALSNAVYNVMAAPTTIARAAGQPRYETFSTCLILVLNIAFTILLMPLYGLAGLVAGNVVSGIAGLACYLALFHRRFPFSWNRTVIPWLWRAVAATVLASGAIVLLQGWESTALAADRLTLIIGLGMSGSLYLMFLVAGLTALGFWNEHDIQIVQRAMERATAYWREGEIRD